MTPLESHLPPLTSTMADDPAFAELIVMFVDELHCQIDTLAGAIAAMDRDTVHHLAHIIKGAAGSYGFDPVTDAARKLDDLSRCDAGCEQIQSAFEELRTLCQRIQV